MYIIERKKKKNVPKKMTTLRMIIIHFFIQEKKRRNHEVEITCKYSPKYLDSKRMFLLTLSCGTGGAEAYRQRAHPISAKQHHEAQDGHRGHAKCWQIHTFQCSNGGAGSHVCQLPLCDYRAEHRRRGGARLKVSVPYFFFIIVSALLF